MAHEDITFKLYRENFYLDFYIILRKLTDKHFGNMGQNVHFINKR